jgi:hypothetical protein
MNKLTLHLHGWLKRFGSLVVILVSGLLLPDAHAATTTVVARDANYVFTANPYAYSAYDLLSDESTFFNSFQGGEVVYVWDCSEQTWQSFIFMGLGVGTGLGYGSDWVLGDVVPPAAAPSYAQADVVDGFYWLNATAAGAPSLAPGVGFFVMNPNNTENITFSGTPNPIPSPQPCGCGTLNAVGSTYTSTADYQDITGQAPVDGSLFELWSGTGFYVFTYTCGGWQAGPNVPNSVSPVANPAQGVLVYTPCTVPSGLSLSISGPAVTAPGDGFAYTVSVNNYNSSPTVAGTLTLSLGIPSSPTRVPVLSPPSGYVTSDNVSYFTINVPALAGCSSTTFSFYVQCGTLQSGDSFVMSASLNSATSTPLTVNCVSALDPNCKTGPAGIGPRHYLTGAAPALPYTITFENEPTASAPAQRVVITDQLDRTTMGLASVQFGPITFGSEQIVPPVGENPFNYTVTSYNIGGHTINVQISATNDANSLSPTYGRVTWVFQAIDPTTGLPPTNPLIGFLPPDTAPPAGQGTVALTVNSLSGLVTGDLITNSASVVFDANSPIATQTWTNTVITTLPVLTISKVPAGQVKLTWPEWTLQEAGSLAGPWSNSLVQVSPWTFTPVISPKFYRLAAP